MNARSSAEIFYPKMKQSILNEKGKR